SRRRASSRCRSGWSDLPRPSAPPHSPCGEPRRNRDSEGAERVAHAPFPRMLAPLLRGFFPVFETFFAQCLGDSAFEHRAAVEVGIFLVLIAIHWNCSSFFVSRRRATTLRRACATKRQGRRTGGRAITMRGTIAKSAAAAKRGQRRIRSADPRSFRRPFLPTHR